MEGKAAFLLWCVVAQLYQQPQSIIQYLYDNYIFVVKIICFHFPLAFGAVFRVHGFGLSSAIKGLSIFKLSFKIINPDASVTSGLNL